MKNKLTDKEKFCLAGYYLTRNADLAYLLSREKPLTANDTSLHRQANRWVSSRMAKEYLEGLAGSSLNQSDDVHNRNKSDIVAELNKLANQTTDPKQRTDILLKLADLERMKEDKQVDDNEQIHFFLPLHYPTSCKDCGLNPDNVLGLKMSDELKKQSRFFNYGKGSKKG